MYLLLCFIHQLPASEDLFRKLFFFFSIFFISSVTLRGAAGISSSHEHTHTQNYIIFFLVDNRTTFGPICEVSHYSIASICTRTIIGFSRLISFLLIFTVRLDFFSHRLSRNEWCDCSYRSVIFLSFTRCRQTNIISFYRRTRKSNSMYKYLRLCSVWRQ